MDRARSLVAAATVLLLLSGCARFGALQKNLDFLEASYSVRGVLATPTELPVYVAIWERGADGVTRVVDTTRIVDGEAFSFMLPPSRDYYIGAVEDANGNQRHDRGERAWVHGDPSPVVFKGRHTDLLQVRLESLTSEAADILAVRKVVAGRTFMEMSTGHKVLIGTGEVVSLDESRFSSARGETGLWEPATYLGQGGFGVYALRRYDAGKVPVLFVHGAEGSPQDLRPAMEALDRKRFQPWFFAYPSGLRLQEIADALSKVMDEVHGRYQFRELYVVAHSMGGLVSRQYVINSVVRDRQDRIKKFVTISTPWNGHPAASIGVKRAPTVVPSWKDMQPGSAFARQLFDTSLRDQVAISLFFGFRSERKAFLPRSNDGSVSVASQLQPHAQQEADHLRGFDESHMSILSSAEVLTALDTVLKHE